MSPVLMGVVQICVVAVAVSIRWTSAGWFLIIGFVATLGLLPAIVLGPLIFAGFAAPAEAWPLLLLADVLLVTSALTLVDGGDNGPLVPVLDSNRADGRTVDRVGRIGLFAGAAYLLTLVPLLIWSVVG
ncbi:hypothetical protein [Nocardia sp. NPDC003345]